MNGINNNIVFRGALGDRFVNEITVNHQIVTTSSLLEASRAKLVGLDSGKVCDIFESFVDGLIAATKEKISMQDRIDSMCKELPQQIHDAIKATEQSLFSGFKAAIANKDREIETYVLKIRDLKKYESMAKVKSLDEIDTVMPETAISTAKEMAEHKAEAEESMLTYLLTGKGQEKVLEQAERAQILVKAMQDGITEIPEVENVIQDNRVNYAEPLHFLKSMMFNVLQDDKASVIVAPVFAKQIKTNMMGLLTPHCNEQQYYSSVERISKSIDEELESSIKFQKSLAARKLELKREIPDASKIIYDRVNNNINVYDANGEITASRWLG